MAKTFSEVSLRDAMTLVPTQVLVPWKIDAPRRAPSAHLLETFKRFSAFDTQNTDAAKMLVVDALLLEIVPAYPTVKVFKGMPLKGANLCGVADYLVAPNRAFLKAPVLCGVAAKRDNFVAGQSRCIAEMVACRENSATEGQRVDIHGIVSNGDGWEFYKLDTENETWQSGVYSTIDLPHLLGAIDSVIGACAKNVPAE